MPAYNAEKYLREAMESVLSQSFENFELIVINDGSKDNTIDICSEFEKKDKRVKLIDKKNGGVAAARNDALDVACGQYVMFVDSDDIIYPKSLQTLYDILAKNPYDYLRFEYQTIDEGNKPLYPNYEAKKRHKFVGMTMDSSKCIKNLVRGEFFSCVGVFRRSVIENNHIRLLKGCTYNEDTLFMMEFFRCSETHAYEDDVMYGYRKTTDAATAHFTDRNYSDVCRVVANLIGMDCAKVKIEHKVLKKEVERLCLHLLVSDKEKFCKEDKMACEYCMSHPIMLKWKILTFCGINLGLKLLPILNLFEKVLRRF